MVNFLAANAATIVISSILVILAAFAVRYLIRSAKAGKCAGCSGCGSSDKENGCNGCGRQER